jgi:hypothetical protein
MNCPKCGVSLTAEEASAPCYSCGYVAGNEIEIQDWHEQRDELLTALKDLVGVFEIRDFVRPELARARQVIAKAERTVAGTSKSSSRVGGTRNMNFQAHGVGQEQG